MGASAPPQACIPAPPRGWAFAALAILGTLLIGFLTVAEASAKGRGKRGYSHHSDSFRSSRGQGDWERDRRESDRAMQRQMYEQQRDSERRGRQMQGEYGRDSRRDSSRPTWDSEPNRRTSSKEGERDARGSEERRREGAAFDDDDFDDDDSNLSLNPAIRAAERQARRLEQFRREAVRKAEREHEEWRKREAARAGRSPPSGPRGGTAPPFAAPTPEDEKRRAWRPVDDKSGAEGRDPDKSGEGDVATADASPVEDASRRVRWLDGFQQQASHLGMGRNARGPDKGANPTEAAQADAKSDSDSGASNDGQRRKALPLRQGIPVARGAAQDLSFPGKERGGELPPAMYKAAREEELVVVGLSPVDLETAKLHGFVASEPTVLAGSRAKVQRIRGPSGAARDEAERDLHKILPFLTVTPNRAYTIYMGSLGVDHAPDPRIGADRRKVSPASLDPCPADRCFGRELIKWKNKLRSCTQNVRIGVIDTSFDVEHPAFKHIKVEQGEFLDGEAPSPFDWHGTAVLSLLAGDPESGTPGLAPDATFLLATAFRSDEAGNASTDTVRLLAALAWLDTLDVDIVNMSFSGPQDPAIARAIDAMVKKGVVFVAAAGNMGPTAGPSYPAAYNNVIAVTAINRRGMNYRNANRGRYIDVAAPGVDIVTALPNAKQGYRTGTSFAAPFVTAILAAQRGTQAAVMASADGTADELRGTPVPRAALLKDVAVRDLGPPGRDPIYGSGLALAPAQCSGSGMMAAGAAPPSDAWFAKTTLIKAGAGGLAP